MKTLSDLQTDLGVWPFPCDCGDHRHALVITSLEDGDITVEIADYPPTLRQRFRAAWFLLWHGEYLIGEMVVRGENIEALVHTLRKAAFPLVVLDGPWNDTEVHDFDCYADE